MSRGCKYCCTLLVLTASLAALALPLLPRETRSPAAAPASGENARSTGSGAKGRIDTVAGSRRAYLFLSANTDEGLTILDAQRRLNSDSQRRCRALAGDVLGGLGSPPHQIADALGDWSDGAENSVLVVIANPPRREALRHALARFGLRAGQKSVLYAVAEDDGRDAVYEADVPEPEVAELRRILDRHGIRYRTLLPTGRGHRVVVYDEGRRLRAALERLAEHYRLRVRETAVRGEVLGGDTRDEAQRVYRRLLRAGESPHPQSTGWR